MVDIILLEDERILREELAEFLSGQGYAIDAAGSLAEFERRFQPERHAIAIIDIGLPDGNGLDLIKHLRDKKMSLGIIVLTARSSTPDKLNGLVRGADYYLPKSTSLDELAGTVAALARRLVDIGGLSLQWVLQTAGRKLIPPGLPAVDLSPHDFVVLKLLIDAKGLPVGRRVIVEALGDDYLTADPARLDTQMRRLRRKIGEATGREPPIKTLRNEGYQFYAPAAVH